MNRQLRRPEYYPIKALTPLPPFT